ncbi:MAG: MltA domain-containing protein [Duodenibacillus sp.]|nr:MltA domain-containing protein [Duodenibacillus sp.]HBC70045.1 transglycosylase [Sutterella sp.]
MKFPFKLLAITLTGILCSCTGISPTTGPGEPEPFERGAMRLEPVHFADLPQTLEADWERALEAFRISCKKMIADQRWTALCTQANLVKDEAARQFFENGFRPWRVTEKVSGGSWGGRRTRTGLMTGYYEPLLNGSLVKTDVYRYPLYSVPDDLIDVELGGLYPNLKNMRLRGKVIGRTLVPYDDRGNLEGRRDLDKNILCWVDDPLDAVFLQIQGSGRVQLTDGTYMRLGYANQNGHPYKALGVWLIQSEGVPKSEMSMQRIRQWALEHPDRVPELISYNPNYVFFERRVGFSDAEGPIGAQGVPLTAEASVAVDRTVWNMGLPFVVDVRQQNPDVHFVRPVIAQDTGGAIRGVIRFDYFWGFGDEAGERAGVQKSEVASWVLVPSGASPESFVLLK